MPTMRSLLRELRLRPPAADRCRHCAGLGWILGGLGSGGQRISCPVCLGRRTRRGAVPAAPTKEKP